jgi:cytochrome c biogenesis protein CcmG/thiol:disulfide interchange protein DsbE
MKRWKIYGLAVALATLSTAAQASDVGKPARDFAVTTLDHQTVRAADLKGKVVILNYWATWCGPCKLEMVAFENYIRAHPGTDLKIYAVMTESEVPAYKLKPLAQALSFPLATHLSGRGYGVKSGVPTSYVIDRSGVIRFAEAGAFDAKSFDALITPLLAEPAPSAAVAVASAR